MAHPDILADPTHHLKLMLEGQHFVTDAVALGMLHRHILAGGALPAQWLGARTAWANKAAEHRAELLEMERDARDTAREAAAEARWEEVERSRGGY